jgi:lipoteichoic acid synthase
MLIPLRDFFRLRVPFFTALILLKILYLRSFIFPQSAGLLLIGLELASAIVIFGLLELASPRKTELFWISNLMLSTYFLASVIYYNYFGQMFNFSALRQIVLVKDLSASIAELFSPAYLCFYLDFFLRFLSRYFYRFKPRRRYRWSARRFPVTHSDPHYKTKKFVLPLVLFSLLLIGFNVWHYPAKDNLMAMARGVGLLNAQGYALLATFNNYASENSSAAENSFNQAAINELKQIKPVAWPNYYAAAAGCNIILVQLESTESFLVGLEINQQQITPNLNRLCKESMYFPYFYSQIGQGNTSDAEFITNTSLYPRARGGIATDFIGIKYPSLPRLLKQNGYVALTFHPNVVTFWNRDNLYPCLGFDQYYDREFYQNEDRLGPWGSSDEVLFKKALPELLELQAKGQKFYASLITLTNHHPFKLPDERKRIKLPSELEGTLLGNYLYSVNYQDYALGRFIEDLKASKLWDKSLLVVFGDHYGFTKAMDPQLQKDFLALLGREHDAIDRLHVPLLIRVPGLKPQVIENVGGQIDILPTLANLLGISLSDQLVFGQDLLNYKQNLLGFRFYNPEGTLITGNTFYLPGSDTGVNIKTRQAVKDHELFLQEEKRIKALLRLADRYLEYLNQTKDN